MRPGNGNLVFYIIQISDVVFEDRSVIAEVDQTLTCTISGLSQDTPVTWIGPDNNEISTSDTNNYVIAQGTFSSGNKESTLTIKTVKLQSLTSSSVFKCQMKSSLYPTFSPEVVNEMTLTLLGALGMLILTSLNSFN